MKRQKVSVSDVISEHSSLRRRDVAFPQQEATGLAAIMSKPSVEDTGICKGSSRRKRPSDYQGLADCRDGL